MHIQYVKDTVSSISQTEVILCIRNKAKRLEVKICYPTTDNIKKEWQGDNAIFLSPLEWIGGDIAILYIFSVTL